MNKYYKIINEENFDIAIIESNYNIENTYKTIEELNIVLYNIIDSNKNYIIHYIKEIELIQNNIKEFNERIEYINNLEFKFDIKQNIYYKIPIFIELKKVDIQCINTNEVFKTVNEFDLTLYSLDSYTLPSYNYSMGFGGLEIYNRYKIYQNMYYSDLNMLKSKIIEAIKNEINKLYKKIDKYLDMCDKCEEKIKLIEEKINGNRL